METFVPPSKLHKCSLTDRHSLNDVENCHVLKDAIANVMNQVSRYNWQFRSPGFFFDAFFVFLTSDAEVNTRGLEHWYSSQRTKFMCFNDESGYISSRKQQRDIRDGIDAFFGKIFPKESSFEK